MKNQSVNRFPKAASAGLAFLLIIIAVLAGYGDTHAGQAPDPAPRSPQNATAELVWVRQDPPIINVNNDPTFWEATEPRFAGSYGEYTITETEITYHERWVDHGNEWYDVTLKTIFDRPPSILNSPDSHELKATASHSGAHNTGSIGMQFWYSSSYGSVIEPEEVLGYYPFDAWWDGTSSKEWTINPPAILGEGDTFEIYASWWNCPPCNITWTYKAEPAAAVERLGIEVKRPTVKYQGEEVPPGEIYFPETCPGTTTNTADSCANTHEMLENMWASVMCMKMNRDRFWVILDLFTFHEESDIDLKFKQAVMEIVDFWVVPGCVRPIDEYQPDQAGGYRIDLALKEGALHLSNLAGVQTTSVITPLGTAVATGQGIFLTAYNPNTNVATFRAYSTPLTLQPIAGDELVLQPPHQVKLTSSGFGSVSELPHLYLPMLTR